MAAALLVLLVPVLYTGCARGDRIVVAFSAAGPMDFQSGEALLAELNGSLAFRIKPKRFMSKRKGERLVGWVSVRSGERGDAVKAALAESSSLELLQVETMTPQWQELFGKYGAE